MKHVILEHMQLDLEVEREEDGRWIAEITNMPGAMAYGQTRPEAIQKARALALRVLADKMEHGELGDESSSVEILVAAPSLAG